MEKIIRIYLSILYKYLEILQISFHNIFFQYSIQIYYIKFLNNHLLKKILVFEYIYNYSFMLYIIKYHKIFFLYKLTHVNLYKNNNKKYINKKFTR